MLKLSDYRHFQKLQKNLSKIGGYFQLRKSYKKFRDLSEKTGRKFPVLWEDVFFIREENTAKTHFDPHYIYHPAWAARILAQTKPKKHVDISSILSFSSIVSAFIPVDFYDYRPAHLLLDQFTSHKADLVDLPFGSGSIPSLSCMHTIEHVGLGRYGDALDPDGDLKAINELKRVLAPNGDLLFVVPIGKPKILFNAHRIYSYAQIRQYFKELELMDFFLIPDQAATKGVIYHATERDADLQNYGCGCFWFKKKQRL
jgi:hypothetical protein